MLLQMDPDENLRTILPGSPSPKELCDLGIDSERHQAYASLWKYMTLGGVAANTLVWLYF